MRRRGLRVPSDRRSSAASETATRRCLVPRLPNRAATAVAHFRRVPTVSIHCEHRTEFPWLRWPRRPESLAELVRKDSGTQPPNEVAPSSLLLADETSQIHDGFVD